MSLHVVHTISILNNRKLSDIVKFYCVVHFKHSKEDFDTNLNLTKVVLQSRSPHVLSPLLQTSLLTRHMSPDIYI